MFKREESYIDHIDGDIAVGSTIVLFGENPDTHQLTFDTPTIEYVDDSPVKVIKFTAQMGNVALRGNYSPNNGSGRQVRVIS